MITLVEHSNVSRLATSVADRIEEDLRAGLSSGGRATLALAGGSTPMPVYRLLAEKSLEWDCVTAVPTDERWVDADHADRNSSRLAEAFGAALPQIVALAPERTTGDASPTHAREVLASLAAPFDHALLGMGSDGHFASLFPGQCGAALDPEIDQEVVAVVPDPMPESGPHSRISLTLSRLLRARRVTLALTGEEKRETLERAAREDADAGVLPVAALLRAGGNRLSVHWTAKESES